MRPFMRSLVLLAALGALVACGGSRNSSDVIGDTDVSSDADLGELPDGAECFDGTNQCSEDSSATATCVDGQWEPGEDCEFGCSGGMCLTESVEGTCATPIGLTLGEEVRGSTADGIEANVWNQSCTDEYGFLPEGPDLVYELEIPAPTAVEIDLLPVDSTYFGVYLRASCGDTATTLFNACDGSAQESGSVNFTTILSTGTWYVIVDDFADNGSGPGEFDLTVSQVSVPSCVNQIPTVLDLSTGSAEVMGDTSDGGANTQWQAFDCPASFDSVGNELVYAFTLTEQSQVRIRAEATEPADSLVGLYVRSDCEDRFAQTACGYADGMGGEAVINEEFAAGTHYIFVDDFASSLDDPQTFTLSVDIL